VEEEEAAAAAEGARAKPMAERETQPHAVPAWLASE
jgi:hypothetical protein